MAFFSEVVIHHVLLFTDCHDWKTTQPHLVNKKFHACFSSNLFAHDYVRNLFHLDDTSDAKLQHFTQTRDMARDDEGGPKKKKRKIQPDTYWWVLSQFVQWSNKNYLSNACATLEKYKMDNCEDVDLLKTARQHLDMERTTKQTRTVVLDDHSVACHDILELDQKTCEKLFGNFHGLFLKQLHDTSESETSQDCEWVLFVDCGFPITIRTTWSNVVNDRGVRYEQEQFFIDGKSMLRFEASTPYDTNYECEYNKKVLEYAKSVIFKERVDLGYSQKERALNTVLYHFLRKFLFDGAMDFPTYFAEGEIELQFPMFYNREEADEDEEFDDFIDDSEV